MAFDGFRNRPRDALDCRRWATGAHTRRNGGVAMARQAQVKSDERQRLIRAYARDHRCSEAEAEDALFGE